jgi:hypothetical protein
MEMFNFSADEIRRLNRALSFVGKREAPLDQVAARTLIVKTENFSDECEQLAPYYAPPWPGKPERPVGVRAQGRAA